MASVADQSLKKTDHSIRFQQIFFLVCALGWLFFSFSAREYRGKDWFPFLLSGRMILFFSSLFLYFLKNFSLKAWRLNFFFCAFFFSLFVES